MKVTVTLIVNDVFKAVPKGFGQKTRRIRNQRENRFNSDHSIVKIGQNIEKSPKNLRKLSVNQTTSCRWSKIR